MSDIDVDFSEIHRELRDVARDVLGRSEFGTSLTWELAAELGWLSLEIPEGLNGSGATFAEAAVVLEEIARATASGPFLGTTVLGVGALLAVDGGARRDDLLRDIAGGSARVGVAFSADGNAASAAPAFRLESGRLEGRARYVADAASADRLLLLAETDAATTGETTEVGRGWVVVSVAVSDLVITPEPVLDESRELALVEVIDLAVDGDDVWPLLGDLGGGGAGWSAQHVLDRGAVALAVDAMGVASAMLDLTVVYVSQRQQFDRPIGSFQAVKHQCADVLVDLGVGRELLDAAVRSIAAADPDATVAASRAKSFLTDAAVRATGVAMQLHGGIGYTWESGIHRYLKRAMVDRALLGSPAEHRRLLGARLRR